VCSLHGNELHECIGAEEHGDRQRNRDERGDETKPKSMASTSRRHRTLTVVMIVS